MKNNTSKHSLKKTLWFSFVGTSLVYLYGLSILSKNFESSTHSEILDLNNPVELSLTVIGIICLGMAYSIPRVSINKATSDFVLYIVRLTCCEAALLFGFLLAYISQSLDKSYPLACAGLVGLFLLYPKGERPSHRSGKDIGLS